MPSILVVGYGNSDREDDGVAWHVLQALATHFDTPISALDGGEFELSAHNPHLVFVLQLTPEMAESLAKCDLVCFVDAHTGAYSEDVRVAPIEPGYQISPFTHHMTPESCLALAKALYGQTPKGLMVSVRGYQFGYRTELSDQTAILAKTAVAHIVNWVNQAEALTDPANSLSMT